MNLYTVEHHKEKFQSKVLEMQATKGKNSRMISRANYHETLVRLKEMEDLTRHKTLADFNLLRRFSVLRVEVNGVVVEKLVKPGSNLRFIPFEDLFDTIHETHVEKGHPGRDIMLKHVNDRFANVTKEHRNIIFVISY